MSKYTPEQIATAVDQMGIRGDPLALYAQATKYAVTAPEIDAALGWGAGTFDAWIKAQGFEPLTGETGLAEQGEG